MKNIAICIIAVLAIAIASTVAVIGNSREDVPADQASIAKSQAKVSKRRLSRRTRSSNVEELSKPLSKESMQKLLLSRADDDEDFIEDYITLAQNDEDWQKIKALAEAVFAIDRWHERTSESVQSMLVDALADFMPKSFPEMLGMLGSSYDDVKDDALDEMKQAIEECDDERHAAEMIVSLSKAVDDAAFAEDMVDEIEVFEPDIAAFAMIGILKNGNEIFKKALAEAIEDITDQPAATEEAILAWAKAEADDDD